MNKKLAVLYTLAMVLACSPAFAGESADKGGKQDRQMKMEGKKAAQEKKAKAGSKKKSKAVPRKVTKEETGKEAVCPVTGEEFKVTEETVSVLYKEKAYYFCCPGCDKSFMKNPEKYLHKKEAAADRKYVCPMGCAESPKPGKCPKCGMNLVEQKTAQKKVYVCPMGEYEGEKPGKCPKCGMELVEKK